MRTYKKAGKQDESATERRKRAPAKTLEARENQLIALTFDLAEKQLRDGTATSQVMTNFLKLGSTKERLEREELEKKVELLTAKTEAIKSAKTVEELYANALSAMRKYSGGGDEDYES
jgi:hypothetical protein